ncbi:MAG: ABC transporter ATP-binding protein [Desulfuromonadales bacterium]|nr:MAG: ABC transporter ATP-binding protein [Desulfuromonadales bacterium]
MSIIEVNNVTKEYRLGQLKSLKHTLMKAFDRLHGKEVEKLKPFKALDSVDFKVEPGEVVGIIGTNGAGKSTLLKILSRISVPTKGNIKVKGSVAPLIEVGAGLVGDLTGRENVYLNGSILGLSRAQIDKKFDEIVAFAELEQFIDTPIKRYSSGMQVRLGFSIATSVDADILIVDEVLAVGDLAFQRKCFDRMEELIKNRGKTVLIVGHNIRQLERICSRMMLLDKGKIILDGEPVAICNKFYNMTNEKVEEKLSHEIGNIIGHGSSGEIEVNDIVFFEGDNNTPTQDLEIYESLRIGVYFKTNVDVQGIEVVIGIHTSDFVFITKTSSAMTPHRLNFPKGKHYLECNLPNTPLGPGVYAIGMSFFDQYRRPMWYGENLKTLRIATSKIDMTKMPASGLVYLPFDWYFPSLVKNERTTIPPSS